MTPRCPALRILGVIALLLDVGNSTFHFPAQSPFTLFNRRRSPMTRTIHVLILSAIVVGCREPPTPPSQKSVEQAWQRTDRAVQQAANTEQQTRHARRLAPNGREFAHRPINPQAPHGRGPGRSALRRFGWLDCRSGLRASSRPSDSGSFHSCASTV